LPTISTEEWSLTTVDSLHGGGGAQVPEDGAEAVPAMEMEGVLLANVAVVLTTTAPIASGVGDADAFGQSSMYANREKAIKKRR
jgi:hypothetical protein